jgi:D-proline reductase (dithiol) PrdB
VSLWQAAGRRRRRGANVPWAPLRKPLADCRLAVVVSSICLSPGRDAGPGVEVGEPQVRVVADEQGLGPIAPSAGDGPPPAPPTPADPSAANLDRNLAQTLACLREAAAAGRLGGLSRRHIAFGGVMAATARAISRQAPEIARLLAADGVDAALLVPT